MTQTFHVTQSSSVKCVTAVPSFRNKLVFKSSRCCRVHRSSWSHSSSDHEVEWTWDNAVARVAGTIASITLATSLYCSQAIALPTGTELTRDSPVYDSAKIVVKEQRQSLVAKLQDFERETGWKVRVYTAYGTDVDKDLRGTWGPLDARTVVVKFDPSSPNLTNFIFLGDEAVFKLRRPWWFELQARYGNLFYVRDEGESAAVVNTIDAMTLCLGKPEGCAVVPGLPSEHYNFTLLMSVVGGLILGFVTLIPPQGFIRRQWVWSLIFSPLWAPIFINFGLGPVITRTDDPIPLIANTLAFIAPASVFQLRRYMLMAPPASPPEGQ